MWPESSPCQRIGAVKERRAAAGVSSSSSYPPPPLYVREFVPTLDRQNTGIADRGEGSAEDGDEDAGAARPVGGDCRHGTWRGRTCMRKL